jgi:hypothetical protein
MCFPLSKPEYDPLVFRISIVRRKRLYQVNEMRPDFQGLLIVHDQQFSLLLL